MHGKPPKGVHDAYFALQRAASALGAEAGDWQHTEVAPDTNTFGHRLDTLSKVLTERSSAISQLLCRVDEPPVNTLEQAFEAISKTEWFNWATPDGLTDYESQIRSVNWIATHVHATLMVLVGHGDMPAQIGNLADIAMSPEQTVPDRCQTCGAAEGSDSACRAAPFRTCSQLIAETLQYVKVAAGQTSDTLRRHHLEAQQRRHASIQDGAAASSGARQGGRTSGHQPDPAGPSQTWRRYSSADPRPWSSEPQRPDPAKAPKRSGK